MNGECKHRLFVSLLWCNILIESRMNQTQSGPIHFNVWSSWQQEKVEFFPLLQTAFRLCNCLFFLLLVTESQIDILRVEKEKNFQVDKVLISKVFNVVTVKIKTMVLFDEENKKERIFRCQYSLFRVSIVHTLVEFIGATVAKREKKEITQYAFTTPFY